MKQILLLFALLLVLLAGNMSHAQDEGGLRLVDVQTIAELPGISDVEHALVSPDGSRLAWISPDSSICTYQFSDETQHCFEQHDGRLTNLYWSPDSRRLAAHETMVYMDDPDVWVIDLQDDSLTNLTDEGIVDGGEDGSVWDETFAWDGDALIFVRNNFDAGTVTLQRINADGTDLTQIADITTMHEERFFVRDIALSPDEAQLALVSYEHRPETNQVWLVDLVSGEFQQLAHQADITAHGVPDWYVEQGISSGDTLMWTEWTTDGTAVIVGTDNPLYLRHALTNTFEVNVETGEVQPFVDWTSLQEDVSIFTDTNDAGYTPALDRQTISVMLPDYSTLIYFSVDGNYSGFSAVTPGQEPVRLILQDRGIMEIVYEPFMPNSAGYGDGVVRVALKGQLLTFEVTDTTGITSDLQ